MASLGSAPPAKTNLVSFTKSQELQWDWLELFIGELPFGDFSHPSTNWVGFHLINLAVDGTATTWFEAWTTRQAALALLTAF